MKPQYHIQKCHTKSIMCGIDPIYDQSFTVTWEIIETGKYGIKKSFSSEKAAIQYARKNGIID